MKKALVLVVLALALAGSAGAATKGGSLTPGGRTLAGPGAVTVTAGGTVEVFGHTGGGPPDVCVTFVNTGRVPVSFEVSGATSPTALVPVGGSHALCAEDVTSVEVACAQQQDCSGQWRVDDK